MKDSIFIVKNYYYYYAENVQSDKRTSLYIRLRHSKPGLIRIEQMVQIPKM